MSDTIVTADWREVEELAAMLWQLQWGWSDAVGRTMKRVGQGMTTVAVREARQIYLIKAGVLRKGYRLKWLSDFKADFGPTRQGRKGIQLFHFRVAPRKPPADGRKRPRKGLRVNVRKDTPAGYIQRGFIAKPSKGGGVGGVMAFEREGGKRTPLRMLIGPSADDMLRQDKVRAGVIRIAEERLTKRLAHEARHVLRRAGIMPD